MARKNDEEKETRHIKEYMLKPDGKFAIKFGTLDYDEPEVLYIRVKSKITPSEKRSDYSETINALKTGFTEHVKSLMTGDNEFMKRHLSEITVSEDGIEIGKKSRFKYDILVRPYKVRDLEAYEKQAAGIAKSVNRYLEHKLNAGGISVV